MGWDPLVSTALHTPHTPMAAPQAAAAGRGGCPVCGGCDAPRRHLLCRPTVSRDAGEGSCSQAAAAAAVAADWAGLLLSRDCKLEIAEPSAATGFQAHVCPLDAHSIHKPTVCLVCRAVRRTASLMSSTRYLWCTARQQPPSLMLSREQVRSWRGGASPSCTLSMKSAMHAWRPSVGELCEPGPVLAVPPASPPAPVFCSPASRAV